jgi:hypothetical protein
LNQLRSPAAGKGNDENYSGYMGFSGTGIPNKVAQGRKKTTAATREAAFMNF